MRRLRGCLVGMLLMLLGVLAPCAIIEGGSQLYMRANNLVMDAWTFRASQPLPYQGSEYFSTEFIAESYTQPGQWILVPSGDTHHIVRLGVGDARVVEIEVR